MERKSIKKRKYRSEREAVNQAQGGRTWVISIAAAFVAAVAVFGVMVKLEKNVLADYEKGTIYVAAQEIPKGQLITEQNYEQYFTEKELDVNCIPKTALCSMEEIQGMFARTKLEEGVLLTLGMFEQVNEITVGMENPVIAGFKAEDLYQVAGGVLRAGDRIHVYKVSTDEFEQSMTTLVWENIFVQEVFDQSGNRITSDDTETSAQRVNVYMDKADVVKFYTELALGSLRVVKVCE